MRPIVSELYSIGHNDITVDEDPQRLIVIVRDGKTGVRSANTMPAAVAVYERIRKRHSDFQGRGLHLPSAVPEPPDRLENHPAPIQGIDAARWRGTLRTRLPCWPMSALVR